MGIKTIKIGSQVTVGKSHVTRVTGITRGKYVLAKMPEGDVVNEYSAADLKVSATEKKPLKRNPIKRSAKHPKKMSQKLKILLQIYEILRKKFLLLNTRCQAGLEGCTGTASEVHHKRGRENLLLIIVKWFLAVCPSCHRRITEHSAEAIQSGLSLPKKRVAETDLSAEESALLTEYKYYERA